MSVGKSEQIAEWIKTTLGALTASSTVNYTPDGAYRIERPGIYLLDTLDQHRWYVRETETTFVELATKTHEALSEFVIYGVYRYNSTDRSSPDLRDDAALEIAPTVQNKMLSDAVSALHNWFNDPTGCSLISNLEVNLVSKNEVADGWAIIMMSITVTWDYRQGVDLP
jgi:hypothetical protein